MGDSNTIYARWLAGDLTAEEEKRLKASGEWEELERILDSTDHMAMPEYNKQAEYELLRPKLANKKTKVLPFRIISSIAASTVLMLSAFLLFQNKSLKFETPRGEALAHVLPDNSKVTLNDGSSISYKTRKYNKARTIDLEGEAYFEVEKGNHFIVETRNGKVIVLGTSFNVRTWGNRLEVTCTHGKVQVISGSNKKVVTPGVTVIMHPRGRMSETKGLDITSPPWMNNKSTFNEQDISVVLQEIGRQFNKDISLPDLQMEKEFSGSFTHDNLTSALEMVCKPMGLDFVIDGADIKISIK